MTDEDNTLYRAFGRLEGRVEQLIQQWGTQDKNAAEGRKALYEKVEELRVDVTGLDGRVETLTTEVSSMKPQVQASHDRHQQGIGSKKIIALVWSAIVTVIGGSTVLVVEVLRHFWAAKP